MPRALLSVFDKTGVVDFARALHDLGWELLSSGGTAKVIADAGIPVIDVATVTGYPAILGHRVVTLHPSIHGALLADTDNAEHVADMHTHNIEPIALAAINLYPFSSNPSIELIDVGGPAMVRAAAKNYAHVAVVTEPTQYDSIIEAIRTNGSVPLAVRQQLAAQAFATTAAYDAQLPQQLDPGSRTQCGMKTIAQKVIPRVIPICYDLFMTQKVGPKGQVVIPKKIRDELGIEPGDEVIVTLAPQGVFIQSVASTKSLKGMFPRSGMLKLLEQDRREEEK